MDVEYLAKSEAHQRSGKILDMIEVRELSTQLKLAAPITNLK